MALQSGIYVTPVTVPGVIIRCAVRGMVRMTGATFGPRKWPLGRKDNADDLIIYRGLATAIQVELAEGVADYWGVPLNTVLAWKAKLPKPTNPKPKWRTAKPSLSKTPVVGRPRKLRWTPQEDEVLHRHFAAQAAKILGITYHQAYHRQIVIGVGLHTILAKR